MHGCLSSEMLLHGPGPGPTHYCFLLPGHLACYLAVLRNDLAARRQGCLGILTSYFLHTLYIPLQVLRRNYKATQMQFLGFELGGNRWGGLRGCILGGGQKAFLAFQGWLRTLAVWAAEGGKAARMHLGRRPKSIPSISGLASDPGSIGCCRGGW